MAPLDSPLSEQAFRKTPLDFVGNSILRWGGDEATQLEFNSTARGWETDEGTVPLGSQWRKNPIPPGVWSREGYNGVDVILDHDVTATGYSKSSLVRNLE